MKAVRICMQNIRKWGGNRRILMCIAMTTLLVYSYTKDLSVLCNYMGQKMNPWIFPFLFAFRYMRIVFMIPVVFIFCDAPFVDTNQTYVMLRTKRNIWSMGQILYIIVSSFLYTLFHLLLTIIFKGYCPKSSGNTTSFLSIRCYHYHSMVIYFGSLETGFASFFGTNSFRIPCLYSPLMSS